MRSITLLICLAVVGGCHKSHTIGSISNTDHKTIAIKVGKPHLAWALQVRDVSVKNANVIGVEVQVKNIGNESIRVVHLRKKPAEKIELGIMPGESATIFRGPANEFIEECRNPGYIRFWASDGMSILLGVTFTDKINGSMSLLLFSPQLASW